MGFLYMDNTIQLTNNLIRISAGLMSSLRDVKHILINLSDIEVILNKTKS